MVLKKTKDHWAFLEEIEAPMWVDLTLAEATFNSQDTEDEWFHTSHPFHQSSSRHLKAAFSCSGEVSLDSEFELQGPCSPKLPDSVSRSRGKDYRSKKWRGKNCDVSLNKPHPVKILSGKFAYTGTREKIKPKPSLMKPKSAWLDSEPCEEIKPRLSFINSKGTSSSKRSLVCERSSTANAKGNSLSPVSSCSHLESSSNSMVDKANESSMLSTVTSESSLQGQQNIIEASSRPLGQSTRLLSAVRIALRKSCVTRPASRVETNTDRSQSTIGINNDKMPSIMEVNSVRRESRDHMSSSSKSSVGSSSLLGFDVKSSTFISRQKEKTPDSKSVVRMTEAPRNRVKVSNAFKVSSIQNNKASIDSKRGSIITTTKSTYKETAKLKVQSNICSAKSSMPLSVNRQNCCAGATKLKENMGSGGLNRLEGGGKENAMGRMSNNKKCSGRQNTGGGVGRSQNMRQQNVPQRGVARILAGQKVLS